MGGIDALVERKDIMLRNCIRGLIVRGETWGNRSTKEVIHSQLNLCRMEVLPHANEYLIEKEWK